MHILSSTLMQKLIPNHYINHMSKTNNFNLISVHKIKKWTLIGRTTCQFRAEVCKKRMTYQSCIGKNIIELCININYVILCPLFPLIETYAAHVTIMQPSIVSAQDVQNYQTVKDNARRTVAASYSGKTKSFLSDSFI